MTDHLSHSQLQAGILGISRRLRLHAHHCSMVGSSPGFPDLVLIGRTGVLWRELKVGPDRLRSAQRLLGYDLLASGQDWAVWTELELNAGTVEAELRHIS